MKKLFGLLLLVVSLNSAATTKNNCLDAYSVKADKRNQIYTAAGTVGLYAITVPLVISYSIVTPLAFVTFTYAGFWWANNPDQFYIANQYKQIERALIAAQKKDYKNKDFQKLALKINKISSKKYARQSSDEKIAQLLTQASHERAICPDITIDKHKKIKFVLNKNELAKYIAAKSQEPQLIIEPGQFEYLTLPEADQNEITRITQEMTRAYDKKNPFCSNALVPEIKVSISHSKREEMLQTTSSISYRCQQSAVWKYAQSCEYRQDEQTKKWGLEYCDT